MSAPRLHGVSPAQVLRKILPKNWALHCSVSRGTIRGERWRMTAAAFRLRITVQVIEIARWDSEGRYAPPDRTKGPWHRARVFGRFEIRAWFRPAPK